MPEFNLIDEPWIPCIDREGQSQEYGIRDTLGRAHELREILDDSPLVTATLHRFLLAILYRINIGPHDFADWKRLIATRSFDIHKVNTYLNQWRGRFDLFAGSHPFYQMAGLEVKNTVSVTRLATEYASGNNATLFNHSHDVEDAKWLPAQAARWLIACQAFASGGGKSSDAIVDGNREGRPNAADGIAVRGMSIWLQGTSLFETLTMNLAPIEEMSEPPWELEDPHRYRDRVGRTTSVGSLSVVDRLTWQSRLVRLLPEALSVSRMYFTQGRSADKSPDDPMKVYRMSKQQGVAPVSLSSRKTAWRDAHSIMMVPRAGSNEQRPECLNHLDRARSAGVVKPDRRYLVQVVGLASAPNKAAKFLLWRHERMPVRVAVLTNANLIERLGTLLQAAEQVDTELNRRVRRIARLYLAPEAESPDARGPDSDEVSKVAESIDPRPAYWARLEKHFFDLLENLPNDWDEASDYWKPDDLQAASNTWREHVKHEAQRALEESVRSLGTTARAIQAVARVRTDFNDSDLKPSEQNGAKRKRKSARGGKQ